MSKLSFIDKLRILLDISKSSSLYIFILALLIFVGIIFITTNKKNAKRNKMIYASISVFILVTLYCTIFEHKTHKIQITQTFGYDGKNLGL